MDFNRFRQTVMVRSTRIKRRVSYVSVKRVGSLFSLKPFKVTIYAKLKEIHRCHNIHYSSLVSGVIGPLTKIFRHSSVVSLLRSIKDFLGSDYITTSFP